MPEHPDFRSAFNGSFSGILRWPQLDELWDVLRADAGSGWYLYAVGEAPPQQPSGATEVERFIAELDPLLRREHQEDYCGLVYVDDKTQPRFVKIYDPHNLGVSCGYSTNPPLPGWVMSKIPPVDLHHSGSLAQSRKRWWQSLFHIGK